jgi:hypothetical protein
MFLKYNGKMNIYDQLIDESEFVNVHLFVPNLSSIHWNLSLVSKD